MPRIVPAVVMKKKLPGKSSKSRPMVMERQVSANCGTVRSAQMMKGATGYKRTQALGQIIKG